MEEVDEDGGGGVCGCASSAAVLVVVDVRAGWRRPESGRGDKDLEERENEGDDRWEEGPPAIGVASDPPPWPPISWDEHPCSPSGSPSAAASPTFTK